VVIDHAFPADFPKDEWCAIALDLARLDQLSVREELAEQIGEPVDGLVNNAGVFQRAPLVDPKFESVWDRLSSVNCEGPEHLTRMLASRMRPGGAVVNVASVRAVTASEQAIAYSVSKALLCDLTAFMADEWRSRGIRVNAVAPGDIATGMTPEPSILKPLLARTPFGRLGRPSEVAAVTAFLLSDLARGITGSIIPIDGGFLCS